MYPKVKVRVESQDDQHAIPEYNWSSLLSLKDIHFLSLQDSCFPVKENSPRARISKSYVPNTITQLPSVSASDEGMENKSSSDEEDRPNIRASSVPRPRAVLSSPSNDAVIGNKNKMKVVRPSALKNHNMIQNRHAQAQCKVITRDEIDEISINTRQSKDLSDNKSSIKGKKGPALAISDQRRNTTDRFSFVRI